MGDCLMCTLCPGKISYLVSGVPLFTICRMNDLRSELNSRNSVYDASRFTALKMSGIVLYLLMKSIHLIKVEWKFTPANPCCYKPYQTKYPRI